MGAVPQARAPAGDPKPSSHIAKLNRLGKGGDFVGGARDEFLADEAGVAAPGDGAHDRVVDFLGVVQPAAAGVDGSVDVDHEFPALLKPEEQTKGGLRGEAGEAKRTDAGCPA